MRNKTFKVILLWLLAVVLVIAIPVSYLLFKKTLYFSDRVMVLFDDGNNAQNALIVELVSYEMFPHYFHHTYFAVLVDENKHSYSSSFEFNSFDSNFQNRDFIKNIQKQNNENILDEDYRLNIEIGQKNIDIDLKDLRGDFLINNSLERFTYMNLGNTKIKVNDSEYSANFALNRTSSINHGKLILEQNVRSAGNAIFLADNDGTLYYSDLTDVPANDTLYMSHAWAINKDGNILRKDVGEQIMLTHLSNEKFILDLPNFDNAYVKINKVFVLSGIIDYSLLKGELIDEKGEEIIHGFSIQYDNR